MIDKSVISNKSSRMAQYREHLDKMLILLTDKYQLPEISGAPKQIAWAKDIRIKFVEQLDKQISSVPSSIISTVKSQILSQTESRWWIDRKDMSFEEHLIYAKTVCSISDFQENKLSPKQPNITIVDCQADDCVSVHCPVSASPILQKYDFVEKSGVWVREVCYTDVAREGVVNALCLALLQAGHTAKVLPHAEPEVIHDGTLRFVDGRLCVIARSEVVFKAASRIGQRQVFLDGCDKSTIMTFVQNYDVDVSEDVREAFGL